MTHSNITILYRTHENLIEMLKAKQDSNKRIKTESKRNKAKLLFKPKEAKDDHNH